MALSSIELRILGSLLEKERTTPESYPLTTNQLMAACNQKTNRDPVTSHTVLEIEETLRNLSDKGLTSTVRGASERAYKHTHRLKDSLVISAKAFAILAVLMLRGNQTPGELRQRTERYIEFLDINDVEETLIKMSQHQPPLVKNLGRGPGQSQDRWKQLLGGDEEKQRPRARVAKAVTNDVDSLREEVEELRAKLDYLYEHFNVSFQSEGPEEEEFDQL